MDITAFDLSSAPSQELIVTNPKNGEMTEISIQLYGKDSKYYRQARAKIGNEQLNDTKKVNVQRNEEGGIRLLAACTAGWKGIEEVQALILQ